LLVSGLLLVLAFTAEELFSFDAYAFFEPLHAEWRPRVGPTSLPALLLGAAVVAFGFRYAQRWSWRALLVAAYGVGLAWILLLAFVDGAGGVADPPLHKYEYLRTAREIGDVPAMLREFTPRIRYGHLDNWPSHVAGHPPGALLFFVGLARLGVDSGLAVGLVLCALGAVTPVLVLATLRTLGAEPAARTVAPFLTVGPSAIWVGVSADGGLFAPVVAGGLLLLAVAARRHLLWVAAVAGLVLGYGVHLSYGFVLVGLLALAVLAAARSWRPLLPAVAGASAVTTAFMVLGYSWLEAYPLLRERYYAGWGGGRAYAYWVWANLAAFLLAAGLVLGVAVALLVRRLRQRSATDEARVPMLLGGAALVVVLAASLSGMSKAEVERIWLPFLPWALLLTALLPARWRPPALAVQVTGALVVQHLFFPYW